MDYTLIRSRRKSIAIIVSRDGSVVVRAPLRTPVWKIKEFIQVKEDWIRKKKEIVRKLPAAPVKVFRTGETFLYLGQSYPLVFKEQARPPLIFSDRFELAKGARSDARDFFIAWYKQQARRILLERVNLYASKNGFKFTQVKISSARTRWGSCSSKGTLSFTWRLVMAPLPVIDYVVVHELAHTAVHNHSQAFWSHVQTILPGYRTHRDWLKTNGIYLTL